MEIKQSRNGEVNIFEFVGNLDTATSPEAEKAIMDCIDGGETKLVLNLGQTAYISSSGLRIMLATAKKLKNNGVLRICNLNTTVKEVFEISGFISILNVDETLEATLSNF